MARLVVLGGGESGYGSAVLGIKQGFDTFLSDRGVVATKYAQKLKEWGVSFEQGGHSEELILSADQIVKSPGIPDTAPIVLKAREKGIPVISEIEFAGRYTNAKTICITGSNGKTTTTTLTYKILRDAGYNVAIGGNIGESFAYSVATADFDWYVLEISSFQLDGMSEFRADIAVLMNITPDHLDRYNYNMQSYVDSKMGVMRNQRPEDFFIYCADDSVICRELCRHEMTMNRLPFSVKGSQPRGAEITEGEIVARVEGRELYLSVDAMKTKGIHNIYNAMAASMAAMAAGVDTAAIVSSIMDFTGVEHRLEIVSEIGGVLYINDSKATNVDSVWYALESMTRPVVWIAGGTDKGNDYTPLIDFAAKKVRVLICLGVDNEKLKDSFKMVIPVIYDTKSLSEAMAIAKNVAQPGDVVLLSPACASFDLFKNYEDRGIQFKQQVLDCQK